jgi:hypothetical protein
VTNQLYAGGFVRGNSGLRAGSGEYARLEYDDNNNSGSSLDIGIDGVFLDQTASENSGFAANGDRSAIWSPGDGSGHGGARSSLLTIYDEDGMDIDFWFRDGGYGYADGRWYTFSDGDIKENFTPIRSALNKVMNLRGITYDLKSSFNDTGDIADGKEIDEEMGKRMNGFIAQEVKLVVPEVVHYVEERQLHAMDYDGLIPVLVEAIKEQQKMIEDLKKKVERLEEVK